MRLATALALVLAAISTYASAQTPPAQTTPSQAPVGTPATTAPLPVPPPVAYAQLQLPAWMRIGVEHRGRLEAFSGAGFATDRDDLYWLNRFRITARFSLQPWLSASVQAQDARVEGRNGSVSGPPFRDQFDLRLAYIDVGNVERSRIAIRLGRQELAFGDQRLVGHVSWLNTARSFDAVRSVVRYKKARVDAFAASPVFMQIDKFNWSGAGNYFYGADAPIAVLPFGGVMEPYEFVRHTRNQRTDSGGIGTLVSSTTGIRLVGRLSPRTDYNVEAAIQQGSLGSDELSAWAGHWLIGHMIPAGGSTYRFFGEYNYASGDERPGDGRRGTFDQLYPTGHDKYGLADQVGWKNIHHVRTGIEFRPQPKLVIGTSYHSYWLASIADALYTAGGAVLARLPVGTLAAGTTNATADRHVGQELDIHATFTPSPRIQVHAGYGHLFTGAFLKTATPGKSYSAPYLMVTTMVLGMER